MGESYKKHERELEREAKRPCWKRCCVCDVLLKGQTREVRVDEGKWACFRCSNRK